MTKKIMRGLVPVMVLSAAAALFTGCGSKDSGADANRQVKPRKPKRPDLQRHLRTRKLNLRELLPRELLPRIP